MVRMRQNHQPHIRGKWRGSVPQRKHVPYCVNGPQSPFDSLPSQSVINLPGYCNRYHGNSKAGCEVAIEAEKPAMLLPRKGRSRKCFITKLPMEILLQIAEYVVSTGTSFHTFPSTRERWGGARKTIMHKFSAEAIDEDDRVRVGKITQPREHMTALAQTCRILSEAYYEVMYGSNHFIFEVAAADLFPKLEGPTSTKVESWTRLAHGKLRQPLWPLTKTSVQYVKHVTILGTLHWDEKRGPTCKDRLYTAVHLLAQARQLNDLTVDLRESQIPLVYNPKLPPHLQASSPMNVRLGWGVRGSDDSILRLRETETSDAYPEMAEAWDLFNALRGVREVVLSGQISEQLADELRTRMMSQTASSESVEKNGKKQKASVKRKRAGESLASKKSPRRA